MSSYRPLRFVDASARADEIVANDKLGIGTHSQTSELHIKADAPELRVQDEVSEVTETALRITANTGTVSFQSGTDFTEDSKGDFKFESMHGGTTHMTIDGSTGRVGVGTDSPVSLLHIDNGVLVVEDTSETNTKLLLPDGDGTGGNLNQHFIGNTHVGVAQFVSEQEANTSTIAIINKDRDNNTNKNASIGFYNTDAVGTSKYAGKIGFWPDNGNNSQTNEFRVYTSNVVTSGAGYDYPQQRFVIDKDGNVGIGTTSPEDNLHVYGNILGHPVIKTKTITKGSSLSEETETFTLNADENRIVLNNNQGSVGSTRRYYANFTSGVPTTVGTILHLEINSQRINTDAIGRGHRTVIQFNGTAVLDTGYIILSSTGGNDSYERQLQRTIILTDDGWKDYSMYPKISSPTTDDAIIFSTTEHKTATNLGQTVLTERMRIADDGNVGIGTVTPHAKLHVNGYDGTISSASRSYWRYGYTAISTNTNNWTNLSIYGNGSIGCGNYFVSHNGTIGASDTRIKKNIVDADDAECLETLRLLKPKKYQYKDEIERGTEPVWGFIAQEVRETLPYATQLRQDVLPNIYELANVSQSNVITFTNFNTSNLESNATTLIRTKGIDGEDHDVHLAEVIDEHTIRVEEDLTEWIGSVDETGNVVAGNQLFIYGQEVDDFVFLKKEAIWTVATSALQEVDRQLQAEKAKVATLETQLASVLARLDALENP